MRTPNCKCVICGKPLYRRPNELAKVRWVACLEHRDEAKRLFPVTELQKQALELGREKACVRCGSTENLESHHIVLLVESIEKYHIKNRDDARKCAQLWDLNNGITLCRKCHYQEHGRAYED